MPWMELPLNPLTDWIEAGLPDWAEALGAFLTEKGKGVTPSLQVLPGYHILALGEDEEAGEAVPGQEFNGVPGAHRFQHHRIAGS